MYTGRYTASIAVTVPHFPLHHSTAPIISDGDRNISICTTALPVMMNHGKSMSLLQARCVRFLSPRLPPCLPKPLKPLPACTNPADPSTVHFTNVLSLHAGALGADPGAYGMSMFYYIYALAAATAGSSLPHLTSIPPHFISILPASTGVFDPFCNYTPLMNTPS